MEKDVKYWITPELAAADVLKAAPKTELSKTSEVTKPEVTEQKTDTKAIDVNKDIKDIKEAKQVTNPVTENIQKVIAADAAQLIEAKPVIEHAIIEGGEPKKEDLHVSEDPFNASILALADAIVKLADAIKKTEPPAAVVTKPKETGEPRLVPPVSEGMDKRKPEDPEIPKVGETVDEFKTRMKMTEDQFDVWITSDANTVGEKFIGNLTHPSWDPYRNFIKILQKVKKKL